jgi:hypothetical protein
MSQKTDRGWVTLPPSLCSHPTRPQYTLAKRVKQYRCMGLLESCYPRIERAVRFCGAVGWVGAQALGLGLLDGNELERLTVQRFEFSSYTDPAYANSGLWLWEREALQRFFPRTGRILVGAAGAGREMIALERAGYAVQGFECAQSLVECGGALLRESGCHGELICAPSGTVPFLQGPFDAAIMGWSGYMYIPLRAQRVKLLRDFRSLLVDRGPLLISFETREACERRMRWSAQAANWIRKVRRAEPVSVGDRLDLGFKHWFNREDVASEMAEAGFELEWYSIDGYGWAVGRKCLDGAGRS